MKTGRITYNMEIPVTVDYSLMSAERTTLEYEGCQEHIVVDFVSYPTEAQLSALIDSNSTEIRDACLADTEE